VRFGDYPDRRANYLSAMTIVSSITDFSRMDEMPKRMQELNGCAPPIRRAGNNVAEPSVI